MAGIPPVVDLGALGFDRGAHLLVKRALAGALEVEVHGAHPELGLHLHAWARSQGHEVESPRGGESRFLLRRAAADRLHGAERAGAANAAGVAEHPCARWGLAARGALVEAGTPAIEFPLRDKGAAWSDDAARLYAQAAAAQWDPAAAIDWGARVELDAEVEAAVVQSMTYLIENETAALLVPARFLGHLHPHFREVQQVLAIQVADEARHIEVFTRRAALHGPHLGLSTAGGQASLRTLLEEPDYALALFLLSVLGEGSFLSILRFLAELGPDPITREITRLAGQDEARHVAHGLSHLERHVGIDPGLRARMATAVDRRHAALQHTAGLNAEVFDALVLIGAGGFSPGEIASGWDRVQALIAEMDHGRKVRLRALGFSPGESEALSGLHTRNFM
jgi:hypothetical protein